MNINRSLTLGTQDEREAASKQLKGPTPSFSGDKEAFINDVMSALFCSKIVSYAQGFILMRMPSAELPLSVAQHPRSHAGPRAYTHTQTRPRPRMLSAALWKAPHMCHARTLSGCAWLFRRGGG